MKTSNSTCLLSKDILADSSTVPGSDWESDPWFCFGILSWYGFCIYLYIYASLLKANHHKKKNLPTWMCWKSGQTGLQP